MAIPPRSEVSVIIPTYRRPQMAVRAASCALGQTMREIEIIVAVDGGDPETCAALAGLESERLRIVPLTPRRGNAGARNAAIALARGEWIALLDDDDGWIPDKLEKQLAFARQLDARFPIVSCRFEAVGNGSRFVWPAEFPRPGQPLSEYLFTRRQPAVRGAIQTSTLLVPRALFEKVRFDEHLDRYVDLDWLLRAAAIEGVELHYVPGEVLSTYSIDDSRRRISNQSGWQRDVTWIRERAGLVTRRAYGSYLLTQASIRAEKSRDKSAFLPLLLEAVTRGRVSLGELLFHVGNTFLPPRLRRALTSRLPARAAPPTAGDSPQRERRRTMRVLLYSAAEKADAAGVQGVVLGLANHLRKAGDEVVTAWPDGDGTSHDWRLRLEAGVGKSGRPTPLSLARAGFDFAALAARLAAFRPDVVNLHYPRGQTLYFGLLKRLFGYRLILSFHGSDYHEASEAVRARFAGWLKRADGVTAVSQALRENLATLRADVPVAVIGNGVDTDFWCPGEGVARDPGLAVAAGRLLPVKGFDILLAAMAEPDAAQGRLIIAGEGSEGRALREQIRRLGLEDRVELAGRLDRDRLRDLFRRAGLFVMPSRREGSPLVLLEAMACGLPAVATAVGGVPQVMTGDTGEMVPPNDPAALARAIGWRLGRRDVLESESARASERAMLFGAAASYDQYARILGAGAQAAEAAGSPAAATRLRKTALSETSVS